MENGATGPPQGWRALILPHVIIFSAALLAMAWQFMHPGLYYKIIEHAAMLPKYMPQFEESFRQGILYPRWMPEDWGGYGSPAFVFYSPLLFFLTALVDSLSGMGMIMSVVLVKFLCLYTGGAFLFYFVRKPYGNRAALIAAALYILLPTRLVEFYLSNTPPGSFAIAWMPAVMLFTRKLVEEPLGRANLAGTAASYSLLILSHLATAYIFTPFVIVYALAGTKRGPLPGKALRLSLGLAAGIGLSAFFFTSVLLEQGYAQLDYLTHTYDFSSRLLFNAYHPAPSKVEVVARLNALMRYSVYLEVALAAMLYLWARWSGFRPARQTMTLLLCLFAAIFMMSSFSGFLWVHAPGLKAVAFPTRFATVYLLFLSILLGLLLDLSLKPPLRPFILTVMLTAAVLIGALDATLLIRTSGISELSPKPAGEVGLFPEYLPRAVDQKILPKLKKDDPPLSSADSFTYGITRWDYINRLFSVDSPAGACIRVRTFYFPGWRAWVDGKETRLSVQGRSGAILMDVPAGRHEINLKFADTPPRKAGKIVSLLTLVALALPYGRLKRLRTHSYVRDKSA